MSDWMRYDFGHSENVVTIRPGPTLAERFWNWAWQPIEEAIRHLRFDGHTFETTIVEAIFDRPEPEIVSVSVLMDGELVAQDGVLLVDAERITDEDIRTITAAMRQHYLANEEDWQ